MPSKSGRLCGTNLICKNSFYIKINMIKQRLIYFITRPCSQFIFRKVSSPPVTVCYVNYLIEIEEVSAVILLQELFLPPLSPLSPLSCIILTARPRDIWSDKLWSVSLVWVWRQHGIMAKPDMYADIDFDEINEATNLAADEIKCLKVGYLNTLISPIKPHWP